MGPETATGYPSARNRHGLPLRPETANHYPNTTQGENTMTTTLQPTADVLEGLLAQIRDDKDHDLFSYASQHDYGARVGVVKIGGSWAYYLYWTDFVANDWCEILPTEADARARLDHLDDAVGRSEMMDDLDEWLALRHRPLFDRLSEELNQTASRVWGWGDDSCEVLVSDSIYIVATKDDGYLIGVYTVEGREEGTGPDPIMIGGVADEHIYGLYLGLVEAVHEGIIGTWVDDGVERVSGVNNALMWLDSSYTSTEEVEGVEEEVGSPVAPDGLLWTICKTDPVEGDIDTFHSLWNGADFYWGAYLTQQGASCDLDEMVGWVMDQTEGVLAWEVKERHVDEGDLIGLTVAYTLVEEGVQRAYEFYVAPALINSDAIEASGKTLEEVLGRPQHDRGEVRDLNKIMALLDQYREDYGDEAFKAALFDQIVHYYEEVLDNGV